LSETNSKLETQTSKLPMFDLSVIVPTHNRKDYLAPLLENLGAQDYPGELWELVSIDDGSSDGTADYLRGYEGPRPANMRVISQPQSGVATARNNASWAAEGRALLYLDDDMVASPRLVGEHARAHLQDPKAVVIGHVTLPPTGREPWVAWEDAGMVRHFDALKSGKRVPSPRDFYSGNCSVSAGLFKAVGGYDTTLKRTEDVEIGYRLKAAGANFYYRPDADSLHLGTRGFEAWLRNARLYGHCDIVLAWEKGHTELQTEIFRWFHMRQSPNRVLVRICSAVPVAEGPIIKLLDLAGRATYRLGFKKGSNAAYSAIYNLAYWMEILRELGKERFWQGVRQSASGATSPKPAETDSLRNGDARPVAGEG
jgi:glycosyltransferase involved in cell wall biosynthesis